MSDTYFNLQSEAINTAFQYAKSKGFEVIEPGPMWREHIDYGKTWTYHMELRKGDKLQKKMLHISIYRMDNGRYELNQYIN